ncbi:MAG: DUF973 family protein [Euryarchaeota archaeon]|nr:DUF973 family protein [Euryarchaeota archaeon]
MVWTSSEQFEARKKAEINAISALRSAFFIGFISSLFSIVIVSLIEFALLTSIALNTVTEYENPLAWIITLCVAQGVNIFFTLVYLYALDRSRKFIVHFTREFDIVKPGVVMVAIGITVNLGFTIVIAATGASFPLNLTITSMGISILGIAIVFIGNVLIAIGIYRLGEHYRDSDLKLYAILMIFLGIIGIILVYSALGNIIKKIENRVPPPPVPPWLRPMEKHL